MAADRITGVARTTPMAFLAHRRFRFDRPNREAESRIPGMPFITSLDAPVSGDVGLRPERGGTGAGPTDKANDDLVEAFATRYRTRGPCRTSHELLGQPLNATAPRPSATVPHIDSGALCPAGTYTYLVSASRLDRDRTRVSV